MYLNFLCSTQFECIISSLLRSCLKHFLALKGSHPKNTSYHISLIVDGPKQEFFIAIALTLYVSIQQGRLTLFITNLSQEFIKNTCVFMKQQSEWINSVPWMLFIWDHWFSTDQVFWRTFKNTYAYFLSVIFQYWQQFHHLIWLEGCN